MKKAFLGAALLLMIGAAHASDAPSLAASFLTAHPFSSEGRVHVRQNILSSELPAALLADIKRDYKDYWITALSEDQRGKHSDYYMTVENADQIVEMRSSDSANWEITTTVVKE
jgi:hypothetical protein